MLHHQQCGSIAGPVRSFVENLLWRHFDVKNDQGHRRFTPSKDARNSFRITEPQRCVFIPIGGPQAHDKVITRSMTGEFRSVDLRVLAKSALRFKLTDPVTIKM
jgi:hypothetical protein